MIQKQAFIVTLVNMFAHTHKCKYPHATPEAEPRGILLIKDQQKITNFKYNETTGLVSFDYEVTLYKYTAENSSKNEVKVTGQVEVTVQYDKVINHVPTEEGVF